MKDNFDLELLNEKQRQEAIKELCSKPDDFDLLEQLKEERAEKKLSDWSNSKDEKF